MLIPNSKKLEEQINNDETYKCSGCKKTFKRSEMKSEKLPDNFHVHGFGEAQSIPKCPYCGYMGFFGFEIV